MTVCQNKTIAGVESGADKWVLGNLTVAFGRKCRLIGSVLNCVSAFVGLRFRHPQGTARAGLDEIVRSVNQANPGAVIHPQPFSQRYSSLQPVRRVGHFPQQIVCVLQLFLLRGELRLLLSYDLPGSAGLSKLCKPDIKCADDGENDDGEDYDLGAGINLTHQLARKLAQENLGIVAARGGRSFHGRLLDKWRDMCAAAAPRNQCSISRNRKEVNRRARGTDPDFISVVDRLVWLN